MLYQVPHLKLSTDVLGLDTRDLGNGQYPGKSGLIAETNKLLVAFPQPVEDCCKDLAKQAKDQDF